MLASKILDCLRTDVWKTRCAALTNLSLNLDADTGAKAISERGLTEFLKNMRQLSLLDIRLGFEGVWSFEALTVLAQYPSLTTLEIPEIPDNWILDLVGNSTMQLFPKLNRLGTGLSEFGLEMLLPHLKEIFGLEIALSGQSTKALRLVADVPGIRFLSFSLNPRSDVRGEDLIRFAKNSPGLEQLELPAAPPWGTEPPVLPSAHGITDATINEVARLLPELDTLRLDLENCPLTEASLLSLGTRCKKLTHCYISADISFEDLRREAPPGLFPELTFLGFNQPRSNRRHLRDVNDTARWLVREAPELYELRVGDNNLTDTDIDLEYTVDNLIDARRGTADDS